jgi:ATP-dependent DNA helicase RecG
MHRDYETNAPVQFYEYDDRIKVQNPGGLYGKVTPDNFPNVSDYRNPFIAEAMKVLGYVNRFSRGVYRVQKELLENGNGKAVFDFSLVTAFKVIENISEKYLDEGFGAEITQEKPKKSPRNVQETSKKRPRSIQEEIVEAIKITPTITRKELENKLGYSHGKIKYHISQLVKQGVIKHEGATKSGKWIIINKD